MTTVYCCAIFSKALTDGTDNEAFRSAVYEPFMVSLPELPVYRIGCDLPDIAFCPWCGSSLISITKGEAV